MESLKNKLYLLEKLGTELHSVKCPSNGYPMAIRCDLVWTAHYVGEKVQTLL